MELALRKGTVDAKQAQRLLDALCDDDEPRPPVADIPVAALHGQPRGCTGGASRFPGMP